DADFDFGLIGGANIPAVDVGLGKASVDIGYNKGGFADLSGDSIEVSATVGRYNAGINWDADSGVLTGVKAGTGVALGSLSKTLQNSINRVKNGQIKSAAKSFLKNNISMTYQRNAATGIRSSADSLNTSQHAKRNKK
ncbi:MAG: hypothetical protein P8Y92_11655, partial [Halioglobus sp.]